MTLPSREPLDATFEVELPPAPYPGLRPFEAKEWPIFFGREEITDEAINRLIDQNLVVVHGDSGCGKSSLVRAGVLAQLEQERARSGASWRTCHMLPREAPLQNLVEAIAQLQGAAPDPDFVHQVHRVLNHGREAPAALAELLRAGNDDNICILVDQFEELFSFARKYGRDEAQLFVDILVGLQNEPQEGLYAILTMRSEFLGVCARFKGLAEAVNQTQYLLPQMERPALLRAIREPAVLYDGEVSRELAERLITDAGGGQDQLPLIQHGLMLLWRKTVLSRGLFEEGSSYEHQPFALAEPRVPFRYEDGPAWRLGLEDYQIGGLTELLSKHADDVMAEACREPGVEEPDPRREKIVEHLFRALTDINAEGSAVRRPQALTELMAVTGSDEHTLTQIVNAFRAEGVSFLTPYGDAEIGPDTLIDISHEALIRCWRKIADEKEGWLQREFQDRLIWQSLRIQSGRFAENRNEILSPAATEYNDGWLSTLPSKSWTERYDGGWSDVQELMTASREEAKRQRELETERRREAERKAQEEKERAEEQRRLAEARAIQEKERADREERLAREAEEQQRLRTEELFESRLTHAALLADGEKFARAREVLDQSRELDAQIAPERRHGRDFLARYVEMMGGGAQQVYEGAGAPLFSVAVSPDGNLLAAVGEKGTVVLFDVASGVIRQRLEGHSQDVYGLAFDPGNAWIVTGGDDRQIIRWSLPTGDSPAEQLRAWEASGEVYSVAVSPDGRLLATGGTDNNVCLWQAETGELVRSLEGHEAPIAEGGLAFSPTGQRLASASADRTARVWDVDTGDNLQSFRGHSDKVTGIVFVIDDSHIATTSGAGEGRATLWEVDSGRAVRVFAGHGNVVYGVAYLAGGIQADPATAAGVRTQPLLVTGSHDRTLRVWDLETGVTLRVLEGHLAGVNSVAVRAPEEEGAATQVFSASNDGTVRRWNITPLPHQHLLDLPGDAWAAAIAPDGTQIAVGFGDGALRLYALPAGRLAAQVENAHQDAITRLVFNNEGDSLGSAAHDGSAKLWSVARDGALTLQETFTGHDDSVYGIAFSPDGKTLATASYDGRAGLFTVGAREDGQFIDAHEGSVASVGFDASGTRLLSAGSESKTARLWDLTTQLPTLIREFPKFGELGFAVLSPDDRLVAAVGRDQVINIYSADDGKLIQRLVGHESTVYRAVFSPDGRQLATVSADATVRLWDMDTGAELFQLRLPAQRTADVPAWDFDFRCTPTGCWVAVPLTRGKLALYDLGPYAE